MHYFLLEIIKILVYSRHMCTFNLDMQLQHLFCNMHCHFYTKNDWNILETSIQHFTNGNNVCIQLSILVNLCIWYFQSVKEEGMISTRFYASTHIGHTMSIKVIFSNGMVMLHEKRIQLYKTIYRHNSHLRLKHSEINTLKSQLKDTKKTSVITQNHAYLPKL